MDDILLPKTRLDFLQIDDTNYNEYIALIESHIQEAKYLIAETIRNGISYIHNIIADNNLGNYRYIGRYQDIGNYRNTINQDIAWVNDSYRGIALRIEAIKLKQKERNSPLMDLNKMRKFEIILQLYIYIKQAFTNQLLWLNHQYDINNNPHTILHNTNFRVLESNWILNLELALEEAKKYKRLFFEQFKLSTSAPHLPPPRLYITPANVASSIAPDITEASVASSIARRRLERSAARSASMSQRPSGGSMATRKKIYRKRNKTKHYKKQIKRYTKKYRIRY